MDEIAPDFKMLCHLCTRALRGEGSATGIALDGAAGAKVLVLAERHRVLPLLGVGLPPELQEPFRRRNLALAQQTAWLEQGLAKIAAGLSAAHVEFLVLKGPALARQAYPVPEWRGYDDLDLWVESRALAAAVRALEAAGYARMHPLNARAFACARRAGIEVGLVHPEHRRLVEIAHGWPALAPNRRAAQEIRTAAVAIDVAGTIVHAPAPVHAPLMACRHGAHHGWDRLVWVADVAGLWMRLTPAEREEACLSARRWRIETMLGLGLRLAADLLECPLHRRAAELAQLPRVRELARRAGLEKIGHAAPRVPMMERLRFERDVQDSALRRLQIMAGWLLVPTLGDIQAIPLPAALYPLYSAIRPLRLLRHPWLRDWRKLAGRG